MIQLITERCYGEFVEALTEMHQLRYRVFKERLDWEVHTSADMEIDSFDALHPAYLVQVATDGRLQGCVRLLPICRTYHAERNFSRTSRWSKCTIKVVNMGKQPIRTGSSDRCS